MREVAISNSQGKNANKVIFEGLVENQELKAGPIGAPQNAMSMTMAGTHRAVSFRILRAYRGVASARVMVLSGMGTGDCGFEFETEKEYLVYADRIDSDNLFTNICTGTAPLEQAGPAVRFLRGEPPTPDDLLDPEKYYEKFSRQWYGTVCGRVTKSDGTPLGKADVQMTQVRDDPFPPKVAADPNLSKRDGSFCIPVIEPGKYLLTAEEINFKKSFRWMGYFPGVANHSEAIPVQVGAGEQLNNLRFAANRQPLYAMRFRIVAEDGSPLPLHILGVAIEGSDRDGLSYHLRQTRNENGAYPAGFVPPGHYLVQTFIQPDIHTGAVPAELAKWRMAKQEVDVTATTPVIVLTLTSAN